MALNKFSSRSDGIVDVYRAALYLARGANKVSLEFLKRARKKLGEKLGKELLPLLKFPKNREQQLFLAEKILDEYIRLKATPS
jgi:hypothetical protein